MNDMVLPSDYQDWVKTLKSRIQSAQQRAVLAVNQELLQLYWQIGRDILCRQQEQGWGAKVIERLAQDLRSAFPDLKGFSRANLLYMRSFAETWPAFHSDPIVQQAVGQIPWGHNLVLISKLKTREERVWSQSRVSADFSKANAEQFAMELESKVAETEAEWKKIDENLLKWFASETAAAVAAVPTIGVANARWMAASLGIMGIANLTKAQIRQRGFSSKMPGAFFLAKRASQ